MRRLITSSATGMARIHLVPCMLGARVGVGLTEDGADPEFLLADTLDVLSIDGRMDGLAKSDRAVPDRLRRCDPVDMTAAIPRESGDRGAIVLGNGDSPLPEYDRDLDLESCCREGLTDDPGRRGPLE